MGINKVGQATGLEIFHLLGMFTDLSGCPDLCHTQYYDSPICVQGGLSVNIRYPGSRGQVVITLRHGLSSPYGFCNFFFLGLIIATGNNRYRQLPLSNVLSGPMKRASERGNAHLSQADPRASGGGNMPEPLMPFTAFLSLSLI
jgi:hypothetical protein